MDFTHFTAGNDDDGRRLDRILRRLLPQENLSSLYKSLRKGLIKVDGKKSQPSSLVKSGSDIQIASFILEEKTAPQSDTKSEEKKTSPLDPAIIIFRNEALLFLNKPYDIPVQPSPNQKIQSLSQIVQSDFEITQNNQSLSFKSGALHRLDRKTTGILAFSQNLQGARWFSQKIQSHQIKKIYLAIIQGHLPQKEKWLDKISRQEEDIKSPKNSFKTVKVSKNLEQDEGKIAITTVSPLSYGTYKNQPVTLASFNIETGRTHQIRSQSSSHGYPLLGDKAYQGLPLEAKYGQDFFLHAFQIQLPQDNPFSLPKLLQAPLPKAFSLFLKTCRIDFNISSL